MTALTMNEIFENSVFVRRLRDTLFLSHNLGARSPSYATLFPFGTERRTRKNRNRTVIFVLVACCLLQSLHTYATEPTPPAKGLNCVFFAPRVPEKDESSLVGIHKRLSVIAEKAGISGHSQVELSLDPDDKKRAAEITAALSKEPVDLLGLTVSKGIFGKADQFIPIMDQALAINPRMQFLIQIPGPVNVPVRDVNQLKWSGDRFHKIAHAIIVEKMRVRYPSTHIHCAYYGRSGPELKTRFEDGDLPGITELVGEQGVFRDKAGNPGPVLDDLNAMLTLSIIYDVDLTQQDLGLGYKANLGPMLKRLLKHESKHREHVPEPFAGKGPNVFTPETWDPPWGYTVPQTDKKSINAVLWGHKFFSPLVEATSAIAEKSGIVDHTVKSYVDKPFQGSPGPGAMFLNVSKKGPDNGKGKEIRAVLDAGKFDFLCLTYHMADTGKLIHYKMWFDYVLARNPQARLLIHLPASFDPVKRDLRLFNKTGDAIRARFYKEIVLPMRTLYPNNEIIFWSSGRVNSEMRRRYEEGKLPQVKQLVGPRGIFAVEGGLPGPLLQDLEGLILYSLIYKADLPQKMTGQEGKLDLNALATEIVAMEKAKGL